MWRKYNVYKVCLKSNGIDHLLLCEKHHPKRVRATGPDDQSTSLERDPASFALHSTREEIRVGQIVAASPPKCTCSQRPEYSWPKEHCRVLEQPLYLLDLSRCDFFYFSKTQEEYQGYPFWRHGGHQGGRNDGAEGHTRRIFPVEAWQRRMKKCIRLKGDYLEGVV